MVDYKGREGLKWLAERARSFSIDVVKVGLGLLDGYNIIMSGVVLTQKVEGLPNGSIEVGQVGLLDGTYVGVAMGWHRVHERTRTCRWLNRRMGVHRVLQ